MQRLTDILTLQKITRKVHNLLHEQDAMVSHGIWQSGQWNYIHCPVCHREVQHDFAASSDIKKTKTNSCNSMRQHINKKNCQTQSSPDGDIQLLKRSVGTASSPHSPPIHHKSTDWESCLVRSRHWCSQTAHLHWHIPSPERHQLMFQTLKHIIIDLQEEFKINVWKWQVSAGQSRTQVVQ